MTKLRKMKRRAASSLSLERLCVLGRAIVLGAAMGTLIVATGCASASSAPSRIQIASFSEQLNVGAYIFTVARDMNGSQSVVYARRFFAWSGLKAISFALLGFR